MKILRSSIESLEPRIAPASLNAAGTVLTYTDIDGDLVKVTFSKAVMETNDFTFSNGGVAIDGDITTPQELTKIDLQTHNGASVTVTATPQRINGILQGDSYANVDTIDATNTNLGSVTVDGDVVGIDAVEVRSFSALSFGAGYTGTGMRGSELSTVGSFTIKGDIAGYVSLHVTGNVKSFSVGGSIGTLRYYSIELDGDVGTLKVGGSIFGQDAIRSLVVGGAVGTFSVGGSIIGSSSDLAVSGFQIELAAAKSITIGGDLRGRNGDNGGSLRVFGSVAGAVKIGGSLLGTEGSLTGALRIEGGLASLTVGGSLVAGSGDSSGRVDIGAAGSVKIGGSIIGAAGSFNSGIFSGGDVGSFTLGHDLIVNGDAGHLDFDNLKTLKIGGDIRSEATDDSTTPAIGVTSVLNTLTIGGSIVGNSNQAIRILVGGTDAEPGAPALKSMTVKHSVIRAAIVPGYSTGNGPSTETNTQAGLGSITIGGDMIGTYITSGGTRGIDGIIGTYDDGLVSGTKAGIASLKIAGALTGIVGDDTYLVYSRNIQKVTIGKVTYTYADLRAQTPHFDSIGDAAIICPG